jgi:AraC-like DNA-binding protein
MKILALHLYSIITYAQLRGLSIKEILAEMRQPPLHFTNETATVSVEDFYAALAYIANRLHDDKLGIRIGEYLNLKALGLVYQISLQTTTIDEALLYLKSFLNATFPIIEIDTIVGQEKVTIYLTINRGEKALNRIILESTLAVIYRELGMMAGEQLIAGLFSPFHSPDYPEHWAKGDSFSITFAPLVLKAAIGDKSRLHLDMLIPEYLKLIESIQAGNSFTTQVKIASLNMAKPELPGLEKVADVFNLTPRTFQRRLSIENNTFRKISDELKKEISYLLIRHNSFTVADVSYVLGYSEPAAFIHSFRKWYGNSPDKVRQQFSSTS